MNTYELLLYIVNSGSFFLQDHTAAQKTDLCPLPDWTVTRTTWDDVKLRENIMHELESNFAMKYGGIHVCKKEALVICNLFTVNLQIKNPETSAGLLRYDITHKPSDIALDSYVLSQVKQYSGTQDVVFSGAKIPARQQKQTFVYKGNGTIKKLCRITRCHTFSQKLVRYVEKDS